MLIVARKVPKELADPFTSPPVRFTSVQRAVLFAENLEQVLITQPHRHLVFTIPKRLRVYSRYDRSLFSALYRVGWETWKEYSKALIPGGQIGAVMALHTAGSLFNWHPHIHMIALDGALLDDGAFRQLELVDNDLLQAWVIDEAVVESMKRWEHSPRQARDTPLSSICRGTDRGRGHGRTAISCAVS